jgi:2'-5' RNA ligase
MRLFVGIAVGEDVRAAAARVRALIEAELRKLRFEGPRLVWVTPPALHVTLRFLGEVGGDRVPALVEAASRPYAVTPFRLSWRGLGVFPSARRPRAIWMGISNGARELGQLEVEVASRIGGLLPGERADDAGPFHPHLTLARVKTEVAGVDWPAILETAAVSDVGSPVGHVSLFRSRGLPGGAGYEEIARGRLGG